MEKSRPTDWRVGPRCCARGTEDRESPRERKLVIALGKPEIGVGGSVDLEKDLAIDQQGEKLSIPETRPVC